MLRRTVLTQLAASVATPVLGQVSPQLPVFSESPIRFVPLSPWVHIERPVSPEDSSLLIARFSGGQERMHAVLCDDTGRLFGMGIGSDKDGAAARLMNEIFLSRENEENGIEYAAWSSGSQLNYGKFITSDRRVNDLLVGLAGIITPAREMAGWTLVWTPGSPNIGKLGREVVIGRKEWPQLEQLVSDMMLRDVLAMTVQSSEIDRFMRGGHWVVPTRGMDGNGLGVLRILKS